MKVEEDFAGKIQAHLLEHASSLIERLVSGATIASYEDYKGIQGRILGLREAIEIVNDELSKAKERT